MALAEFDPDKHDGPYYVECSESTCDPMGIVTGAQLLCLKHHIDGYYAIDENESVHFMFKSQKELQRFTTIVSRHIHGMYAVAGHRA